MVADCLYSRTGEGLHRSVDLWLNESFAEWPATGAKATKYSDAWTTFCNARKNWAYRQDQLPSTHPIAADMVDFHAVEVNFDGITYAKGASALRQLVAFVGEEQFVAGLKEYFAVHAFGNTELSDLLKPLEKASGRDLDDWTERWLRTSGVNTLHTEVSEAGADRLQSWLDPDQHGSGLLPGLVVDTDLRWILLTNLARLGRADTEHIEDELTRDSTITGQERAAQAVASWPTAEAKAEAWRVAVVRDAERDPVPHHPWLPASRPGGPAAAVRRQIPGGRRGRLPPARSHMGENVLVYMAPKLLVEQSTLDALDGWLNGNGAGADAPTPQICRRSSGRRGACAGSTGLRHQGVDVAELAEDRILS